jgi:hypothetical protein
MSKSLADKYKKVKKLSIQRRGEIIERFTYTELSMDNIIARYFCDTTAKTNEITAVVLSIVDFGKKKEIIFYIMDCYKQFTDKYKTIKPDFDKLNSIRNIFAHRYLALFDENIKKEKLSFIKFEKGKPTEIEITKDYFNEKIALVDKCDEALEELADLVKKRVIKK